jgi:1,4-alpha-glucan branching enzyme
VAGFWEEVLNTDARIYGGGNRGNMGGCASVPGEWDGCAQHIRVTLPPLATLFLRLRRDR